MRLKSKVEAAVNVDDVRRKFYNEVAVGDQYWWWVCAMYVDPQELIIDTDEGDIYRMTYSVEGDEIEFGAPQLVKVQYVDAVAFPKKAQAAAAVAGMNTVRGDKVLASFASRDESRPIETSNKEGDDVDLSRLRQKLGLSADAPEAEVIAAAEEQLGEEEAEQEVPAPAPPAPEEEQEGAVVVDASVLASLRADALAGRTAREEQLRERDEAVLASAVQTGRIPPARRAHYAAALQADREGTIALLESLEPDLVPLSARGGADDSIEEGQAVAAVGYPANWLPEVAARKAEIAAGSRSRVTIS